MKNKMKLTCAAWKLEEMKQAQQSELIVTLEFSQEVINEVYYEDSWL